MSATHVARAKTPAARLSSIVLGVHACAGCCWRSEAAARQRPPSSTSATVRRGRRAAPEHSSALALRWHSTALAQHCDETNAGGRFEDADTTVKFTTGTQFTFAISTTPPLTIMCAALRTLCTACVPTATGGHYCFNLNPLRRSCTMLADGRDEVRTPAPPTLARRHTHPSADSTHTQSHSRTLTTLPPCRRWRTGCRPRPRCPPASPSSPAAPPWPRLTASPPAQPQRPQHLSPTRPCRCRRRRRRSHSSQTQPHPPAASTWDPSPHLPRSRAQRRVLRSGPRRAAPRLSWPPCPTTRR